MDNQQKYSSSYINFTIKSLERRLNSLSDVMYIKKLRPKIIHEIFLLKKDLSKLKIKLIDIIVKDNLNENIEIKKNEKKVDNMLTLLESIESYVNTYLQHKQHTSLNILTILQFVFFPLTIITGYYGMNFMSMGSPSLKRGIFSIKNGEKWVFLLMLISIFFCIFILLMVDIINFNYLKFWKYKSDEETVENNVN
tara:strand:- start:2982 stop:3566 length:585 start_codon:yes stop_codon:yes gene_type:complete